MNIFENAAPVDDDGALQDAATPPAQPAPTATRRGPGIATLRLWSEGKMAGTEEQTWRDFYCAILSRTDVDNVLDAAKLADDAYACLHQRRLMNKGSR